MQVRIHLLSFRFAEEISGQLSRKGWLAPRSAAGGLVWLLLSITIVNVRAPVNDCPLAAGVASEPVREGLAV